MRVLLVESTPGNAVEVQRWLHDQGHTTMSCFDSPVTFGCRGVARRDECPLDGPVDATVLVRDLDGHDRMLTEMGAVCAMKHRVPVVEIVEPDGSRLDSTLRAALDAAKDRSEDAGYLMAARAGLASAPGIEARDITGIDIAREGLHVRATVHVSTRVDEARLPMVVDRVGRAIRRHDPYASVIDVGITRN